MFLTCFTGLFAMEDRSKPQSNTIEQRPTPYQFLGIDKTAEAGDIKKSYVQLAKQYHPDKAKGDTAVAAEYFKVVQYAYEALTKNNAINTEHAKNDWQDWVNEPANMMIKSAAEKLQAEIKQNLDNNQNLVTIKKLIFDACTYYETHLSWVDTTSQKLLKRLMIENYVELTRRVIRTNDAGAQGEVYEAFIRIRPHINDIEADLKEIDKLLDACRAKRDAGKKNLQPKSNQTSVAFMDSGDLYAILEISPLANQEEINNAFLKLQTKYKPYSFAEGSQERKRAEYQFKPIWDAFDTLGNKQRRAIYDKKRLKAFDTSAQNTEQPSRKRPSENDGKNARPEKFAKQDNTQKSSKDDENIKKLINAINSENNAVDNYITNMGRSENIELNPHEFFEKICQQYNKTLKFLTATTKHADFLQQYKDLADVINETSKNFYSAANFVYEKGKDKGWFLYSLQKACELNELALQCAKYLQSIEGEKIMESCRKQHNVFIKYLIDLYESFDYLELFFTDLSIPVHYRNNTFTILKEDCKKEEFSVLKEKLPKLSYSIAEHYFNQGLYEDAKKLVIALIRGNMTRDRTRLRKSKDLLNKIKAASAAKMEQESVYFLNRFENDTHALSNVIRSYKINKSNDEQTLLAIRNNCKQYVDFIWSNREQTLSPQTYTNILDNCMQIMHDLQEAKLFYPECIELVSLCLNFPWKNPEILKESIEPMSNYALGAILSEVQFTPEDLKDDKKLSSLAQKMLSENQCNFFVRTLGYIRSPNTYESATNAILKCYFALAEQLSDHGNYSDALLMLDTAMLRYRMGSLRENFESLKAQVCVLQDLQNPTSFDEDELLKELFEQHN